ncbi:ABC transporter ATP-binding protein [Prosthecomicrobium sp. N25]|uniref:ABC transporter ATP-binding protein n=1 Tax=Prosthecomicrobium sp. N25 TaxID=3129254 RepID=UPI003076C44B
MTLRLENVSRVVGAETHIHPTTLTLEKGTVNLLLGPTLSGKTSLMRLMAGLDRPTTGRILMDGVDVTATAVRDRNVAMVYQQFINYPSMTVYENIASPLRVKGASKAEVEVKVREAAGLLKLEAHLDKTPLQLSGGQQQRTAIARAIVKGADLVLLDEPLANLDYKLREELRVELPRVFEKTGAIFVYATTEPSEALLLGGNTATLRHGRITQFGPTIEVYRRPADRVTAETFSDPPMNFALVEIRGGRVALAEAPLFAAAGPLAGLSDGTYTLGFRPHHVALAREARDTVSLSGRVAVSEITGSESFVHVDVGADRWIALVPGVLNLRPGDRIDLHLDPASFFVFDADGRLAAAPAGLLAA